MHFPVHCAEFNSTNFRRVFADKKRLGSVLPPPPPTTLYPDADVKGIKLYTSRVAYTWLSQMHPIPFSTSNYDFYNYLQ